MLWTCPVSTVPGRRCCRSPASVCRSSAVRCGCGLDVYACSGLIGCEVRSAVLITSAICNLTGDSRCKEMIRLPGRAPVKRKPEDRYAHVKPPNYVTLTVTCVCLLMSRVLRQHLKVIVWYVPTLLNTSKSRSKAELGLQEPLLQTRAALQTSYVIICTGSIFFGIGLTQKSEVQLVRLSMGLTGQSE
jgi:hypothetical protein